MIKVTIIMSSLDRFFLLIFPPIMGFGISMNEISLGGLVGIFLATTAVIAIVGYHLTRNADHLADITGLGEAITGAILLGGSTSLSGIITSVTAGYTGHPELAASNAIGGIAAQTAFLAVADITYTRSNLEHAAASLPNIMQGVLLMILLSLVILVSNMPSVTLFGIHPFSPILFIAYILGTRSISKAKESPMWKPISTSRTVKDKPHHFSSSKKHLFKTVVIFILLGATIGAAGYVVARSGISLASRTGLSETLIGSLLTAISTSLPELFVAVIAVRQNALTLAVGNIIGGNTFDILFLAFSDVAYRSGSLYHDTGGSIDYLMTLTMVMTSILVLGLLFREKEGPAKIGWESTLVLLLFIGGSTGLFFFF